MVHYEPPDMDVARVIEVIETTIRRNGKGTEDNVIRIVTQYWSLDGRLLAEVDPVPTGRTDIVIAEECRTCCKSNRWVIGTNGGPYCACCGAGNRR